MCNPKDEYEILHTGVNQMQEGKRTLERSNCYCILWVISILIPVVTCGVLWYLLQYNVTKLSTIVDNLQGDYHSLVEEMGIARYNISVSETRIGILESDIESKQKELAKLNKTLSIFENRFNEEIKEPEKLLREIINISKAILSNISVISERTIHMFNDIEFVVENFESKYNSSNFITKTNLGWEESFYVSDLGNVGIGTSFPNSTLDVNGTILQRGNKILSGLEYHICTKTTIPRCTYQDSNKATFSTPCSSGKIVISGGCNCGGAILVSRAYSNVQWHCVCENGEADVMSVICVD